MLIRILFILIIAYILWVGISVLSRIFRVLQKVRASTNAHAEQNLDHKTMLKCDTCHLYFLDKDAVLHAGKAYCCPEHASNSTA